MYLPYGVNEQGQLVYIENVGRGKTALRCPYCAVPLLARKGKRIAPHFAHAGATCREVRRSDEAVSLPVYDGFNLSLSGKVLEALRRFHGGDWWEGGWLEDYDVVKPYRSYYGNDRYTLTHKGKIPLGELSLNLFNQFQEPLIRERHTKLEQAALAAICTPDEDTALTDLKIFRAQMRRILAATLYFIEVRTDAGTFHKIGVTTRTLDERLAEIRADLMTHFGNVDLKPLGTWAHRGNVELYFKYRYRRFQQPIGKLTEFFAFADVKAVLRDLRRMKPKALDETECAILAGEPSRAERYEPSAEALSEKAWLMLSSFSSEQLKRNFDVRGELQGHRLGGCPRPLVQMTKSFPQIDWGITDFGLAYRDRFAAWYQERHADASTNW